MAEKYNLHNQYKSQAYVYIIGSIEHFEIVKIGISRDLPEKGRIQSLQTGSPFKLYVWATVAVAVKNLNKCEKNIHSRLSDINVSGEWFKINPQEAYKIALDEANKFDDKIKKGGTSYDAFCGNKIIEDLKSIKHPAIEKIFNEEPA